MNLLFNKVERLQKASQDAFSIFTKTVTKLKNINESSKVEIDARTERIAGIQAEVNTLTSQVEANNKVIEKSNQIIS